MISIIEQGFLRRNWGKLALGGGALAFAASRGEEMPIGAAKSAVKSAVKTVDPNLRQMAGQLKDAGKTAGKFVGGKLQGTDPAIQNAAVKTGAAARKVVDYGQKTGQSFQQGYRGSAANVPNVGTPTPPTGEKPLNSRPGQYWNKSFRGQRPNVPNYYTQPSAMA